MSKWVDSYGRAKPKGVRRVYKGSKKHDGRRLPLHLQVRPQKAIPVIKNLPTAFKGMPWVGHYTVYLDCLNKEIKIEILLRNNSNIKTPYSIVNSNNRIVYKINTGDCVEAFGLLEALKEFQQNPKLELLKCPTTP